MHFFFVKFNEHQENDGGDGLSAWENTWRSIVYPFQFGIKHVILFQLALLPLTMSRYSISALDNACPLVNRFLPMCHMLSVHVYVASVMVVLVFLATVVYMIFFGVLCGQGIEEYCTKLTSEIMCSGYAIVICLGLLTITSYLRQRIPYEIFTGEYCQSGS